MLKSNVSTKLTKGEQMQEYWQKIIGITNKMELHIHCGITGEEEWYSNLNISEIMNILEDYTRSIGDEKERKMLQYLSAYFYEET